MAESEKKRMACPGCEHAYRWHADHAGRKVACKQCSTTFTVPQAPGVGQPLTPKPPVADDTYELDLTEALQKDIDPDAAPTPSPNAAAIPSNGKCPSCNTNLRPGAVLCLNCGFNLAEGKKLRTDIADTPADGDDLHVPEKLTATDDTELIARRQRYEAEVAAQTYKAHRFNELYLPLILLGVGFVLLLINAFALTPPVNQIYVNKGSSAFSTGAAIGVYFGLFAVTLVMMIPLLLGGIFFMASVIGSAFGNLFTALLKVLALTVLVIAVDNTSALTLDLITGGLGSYAWFLQLAIVFVVFWPTCSKIFDIEFYEMMIMFLIYVIGPMGIGLLAAIIWHSFF